MSEDAIPPSDPTASAHKASGLERSLSAVAGQLDTTPAAPLEEKAILQLIQSGDIRQCSACGERSAYASQYVTEKESYIRGRYEPGDIAPVGHASCFEWECGHCCANNVFADAPILAECYTHRPPPRRGNLPTYARYLRPMSAVQRSTGSSEGRNPNAASSREEV